MRTISVGKARKRLDGLIDDAAASCIPVKIAGKRHDAVMISAVAWNSMMETLHLLSVPGMTESILDGLRTPLDECDTKLHW